MRPVQSSSSALRLVRTHRHATPIRLDAGLSATYATLVGPTSLLQGQKGPLPPPPPPTPFVRPSPPTSSLSPPPIPPRITLSPSRSQPDSIVRPSSLSPLDIFILSYMRLLRPGSQPTLRELLDQMSERDGRSLDLTLDYEPTPSEGRRVQVDTEGTGAKPIWMQDPDTLVRLAAEVGSSAPTAPIASSSKLPPMAADDGIVLLAHVFPSRDGRGPPRLVTSHGVALKTSSPDRKMILTCAHPLAHLASQLPSEEEEATPVRTTLQDLISPSRQGRESARPVRSGSLVFTPSGNVYPVSSVASSLASFDILILDLGPRLSTSASASSASEEEWKTAPMSPYPAPVGTRVFAHRFVSGADVQEKVQEGRSDSRGGGKQRWEETEIVEYKDEMGLLAQPGTYDSLSTFTFTSSPSSGSSGGPILSPSGSVLGLIRGSRKDYGDRQERGFAVVGERVWEVWRLPGFRTVRERKAERERVERERVEREKKGLEAATRGEE